ncbi:MAG TPA: hypothetical protein VNG53_03725 [Bacteroidia bacterium]|nr:hypothetical protein [Bacteroidia bacterium]
MKNKKNLVDDKPRIKVQLDFKTIITLRNLKSLDLWREKYPEAKIIS